MLFQPGVAYSNLPSTTVEIKENVISSGGSLCPVSSTTVEIKGNVISGSVNGVGFTYTTVEIKGNVISKVSYTPAQI